MATKGILFDFWGTLVENGVYPSPVSQVRYFLRLRNMTFHDYIVRFEKVFMTKEFDSLANGFQEVCKEFEVTPPSWVIEKMVGMWNKNRLLAKPFEDTIPVLSSLKKDYKLGLISNTDSFSVEPLLEKYGLAQYFDSISLSYKEGKLKIDKELYQKALDELKLGSDEVFMVGDSMESDVRSAENAGIKAILLDRRNKREHDNKIVTLNELASKIR